MPDELRGVLFRATAGGVLLCLLTLGAPGEQRDARSAAAEHLVPAPGAVRLPRKDHPALSYLIRSADYTFRLDDEFVRCTASFVFAVFPSGEFLRVPLLRDQVSPERVTVNGKPGDLTPIGGWLSFLPGEPGPYTVEIDFSLKPAILKGIRSVSFTTPLSAVNRARFLSDERWMVTSGRLTEPYETEVGEQTVGLIPGTGLQFAWEEPPPEGERAPRFTVRPEVFYLFEGSDLQVAARLVTTVYRGPARRAELVLPPGFSRLEVKGVRVKRFEPAGNGAIVEFRGKVEGKTVLSVSFTCPARGVLPVPSIRGARMEGGAMAVSCPPDEDILVGEVSGAEQTSLLEIPAAVKAMMRE